jgi:hypothetical protein
MLKFMLINRGFGSSIRLQPCSRNPLSRGPFLDDLGPADPV